MSQPPCALQIGTACGTWQADTFQAAHPLIRIVQGHAATVSVQLRCCGTREGTHAACVDGSPGLASAAVVCLRVTFSVGCTIRGRVASRCGAALADRPPVRRGVQSRSTVATLLRHAAVIARGGGTGRRGSADEERRRRGHAGYRTDCHHPHRSPHTAPDGLTSWLSAPLPWFGCIHPREHSAFLANLNPRAPPTLAQAISRPGGGGTREPSEPPSYCELVDCRRLRDGSRERRCGLLDMSLTEPNSSRCAARRERAAPACGLLSVTPCPAVTWSAHSPSGAVRLFGRARAHE
jgi:hypothetical protein